MSFQTPTAQVSASIAGLGRIDGLHYANGVEQYCGIPYAILSKRWTRSVLKTSWDNDYHDGTQLGNNCPRPQISGTDASPNNPFIPVPANPFFTRLPESDEKTALVINIVIPMSPKLSSDDNTKFPVMAWVHGGSLLYGSANYGIYDAVNLVSHSVSIGLPVIVVSFNYRLGLGGFLAGSKVGEDLKKDGFAGNGNFGFTDQKVAMDWVQKYISEFGGDPNNVIAFGQSAGAISIGHQLAANDPMKFDRAVCMSGLGSTLSPLSLEEHEQLFSATCRYFSIDAQAPDALDQLRKIDQQVLANADNKIHGVSSGGGNPCLDGWFYAHDPQIISEAPAWLKSFAMGDMHDENVIFIMSLMNDTYSTVRSTMMEHIGDEKFVNTVLELYGVTSNLSKHDLIDRVSNMGADAVFKIQNYKTGLVNKRLQSENAIFKYHFDQQSRIENVLKGKAYHGLDVVYLFRNLENKLSEEERKMSDDYASAWIRFANGLDPWPSAGTTTWKVWGPDSKERVETEEEDESVRFYSRFKKVMEMGSDGLWEKYIDALNYVLVKKGNMGKF